MIDPDQLADLNREQAEAECDAFTRDRYRQFAERLPTGPVLVLDVGCANGRGGAALRGVRGDVRLHGLDLVEERLEAIPSGLYERLAAGLLSSYKVTDRYDAILLGELIEHVPFEAFDALLVDAMRLLKPEGKLLLTTPNPHYALLRRRSGGSVLGGAHVSVHCPIALRQYLTYRGFVVENLSGTGKVSKFLGKRAPLFCYGAYMLVARSPQVGVARSRT